MRSCSRSAAGVWATVRFGLTGLAVGEAVWNRFMSPQPASAKTAHSRAGAAQRRQLIPVSGRPANFPTPAYSSLSGGLIPVDYFDLPHMERLDSRTGARLDKAANANLLVFEGLKRKSGRLERRQHAP